MTRDRWPGGRIGQVQPLRACHEKSRFDVRIDRRRGAGVMMLITFPFHDQIGFRPGVYVGYTSMVLAFLMVYFGTSLIATTSPAAASRSAGRSTWAC
jgi:hypothetical protein